jgi:hypothetical protein
LTADDIADAVRESLAGYKVPLHPLRRSRTAAPNGRSTTRRLPPSPNRAERSRLGQVGAVPELDHELFSRPG